VNHSHYVPTLNDDTDTELAADYNIRDTSKKLQWRRQQQQQQNDNGGIMFRDFLLLWPSPWPMTFICEPDPYTVKIPPALQAKNERST